MNYTYSVKMQPQSDICSSESVAIATAGWFDDYCPDCTAQLVYDSTRETFIARLSCKESAPLTRYHHGNEPVYTDSCMEWFCAFDPNDEYYINFEMNSAGTLLAGFGKENENRIFLSDMLPKDEMPTVTSEKANGWWTVTVEIKKSALEKIYHRPLTFTPGTVLRGNFYKCGDETAFEHYIMWSPVESEDPCFHLYPYFGRFLLTEEA